MHWLLILFVYSVHVCHTYSPNTHSFSYCLQLAVFASFAHSRAFRTAKGLQSFLSRDPRATLSQIGLSESCVQDTLQPYPSQTITLVLPSTHSTSRVWPTAPSPSSLRIMDTLLASIPNGFVLAQLVVLVSASACQKVCFATHLGLARSSSCENEAHVIILSCLFVKPSSSSTRHASQISY